MSAPVLLIDNYDSFVFTLARYLEESAVATSVCRNDEITVAQISHLRPAAILLSPGPRAPDQAGICIELIQQLGHVIPILGVCLGHQAIGAAFGGNIITASEPMHGRTSPIQHNGAGLFEQCVNPLRVTRYHSLLVERATLPDCLTVTAQTADGFIMALEHRDWPVYGVQFHPESILTQQGHQILWNFLRLAGIPFQQPPHPGDLPAVETGEDDFFRRDIDPTVFRPL